MFSQNYENACDEAVATANADDFSSRLGALASKQLRAGDALLRQFGYMGSRSGAFNFFATGALDPVAAASFTFYQGTDKPTGSSTLLVGTDPVFGRIVPVPEDSDYNVAQRVHVLASTGHTGGEANADFIPSSTMRDRAVQTTTDAIMCALDAIFSANVVMLDRGRREHRTSSSDDRMRLQKITRSRANRVAFYKRMMQADDEELLSSNIDLARERVMSEGTRAGGTADPGTFMLSTEGTRSAAVGSCDAANFETFGQGNGVMLINTATGLPRDHAVDPDTARRAAVVANLAGLYTGQISTTSRGYEDVLTLCARTGIDVDARNDAYNCFYPGIESAEKADAVLVASSCPVDGTVNAGETKRQSATVATANLAGPLPGSAGSDYRPSNKVRFSQLYRGLPIGNVASRPNDEHCLPGMERTRGAWFLQQQKDMQRAVSDSRFAELRPVSSHPDGFWYSPERQTMVELTNNTYKHSAGYVAMNMLPDKNIGMSNWTPEMQSRPELGVRLPEAREKLSADENDDVAEAVYMLNSSAVCRTVVPVKVQSDEEALYSIIKRSQCINVVGKRLQALYERSGPSAVERVRELALEAVRSPLDSENLPPVLAIAEQASPQQEKMNLLWETVLGHDENTSSSTALADMVSSCSNEAHVATMQIVSCCSHDGTTTNRKTLVSNIVDTLANGLQRPDFAGCAATQIATKILRENNEIRQGCGDNGELKLLNRIGLCGIICGSQEQQVGGRNIAYEARMHECQRGSATLPIQCLDGEIIAADKSSWDNDTHYAERKIELENRFYDSVTSTNRDTIYDGPVGGATRATRHGAAHMRWDALNAGTGIAVRSAMDVVAPGSLTDPIAFDRKHCTLYLMSGTTTRKNLVWDNTDPVAVNTNTLRQTCMHGDVARAAVIASQLGADGAAQLGAAFGPATAETMLTPTSSQLAARLCRAVAGVGLLASTVPVTCAAYDITTDNKSCFGRAVLRHFGLATDKHGRTVLPAEIASLGTESAGATDCENAHIANRLGFAMTESPAPPIHEQCTSAAQSMPLAEIVGAFENGCAFYTNKACGPASGSGTGYFGLAGVMNCGTRALAAGHDLILGSDRMNPKAFWKTDVGTAARHIINPGLRVAGSICLTRNTTTGTPLFARIDKTVQPGSNWANPLAFAGSTAMAGDKFAKTFVNNTLARMKDRPLTVSRKFVDNPIAELEQIIGSGKKPTLLPIEDVPKELSQDDSKHTTKPLAIMIRDTRQAHAIATNALALAGVLNTVTQSPANIGHKFTKEQTESIASRNAIMSRNKFADAVYRTLGNYTLDRGIFDQENERHVDASSAALGVQPPERYYRNKATSFYEGLRGALPGFFAVNKGLSNAVNVSIGARHFIDISMQSLAGLVADKPSKVLRYLTADATGPLQTWSPFGVVQGLVEKSVNPENLMLNGSVKGPVRTYNIWGNKARPGCYLWFVAVRCQRKLLDRDLAANHHGYGLSADSTVKQKATPHKLATFFKLQDTHAEAVKCDYPYQIVPVVTTSASPPNYADIVNKKEIPGSAAVSFTNRYVGSPQSFFSDLENVPQYFGEHYQMVNTDGSPFTEQDIQNRAMQTSFYYNDRLAYNPATLRDPDQAQAGTDTNSGLNPHNTTRFWFAPVI